MRRNTSRRQDRPALCEFALSIAMAAALAGCAATPPEPEQAAAESPPAAAGGPNRLPFFLRVPFEPFAREDAVAIALREWRAFGQLVDDDPPDTRPPLPPELKPERMPGLWQRVADYWWLGQNAGRTESAWTGKHDGEGTEFDARRDGDFAWSAAFISYVMRSAGAGDRFPYFPSHYVYINAAARQALGREQGWVVTARRPDEYPPALGDIICTGRERFKHMRFDRLPAGAFAAHCDIVVASAPGLISVVGGNVDDAVTMKHIPVSPDGRLTDADGKVLDSRYDWFVVLQVQYVR
jgi:hypothetical protein